MEENSLSSTPYRKLPRKSVSSPFIERWKWLGIPAKSEPPFCGQRCFRVWPLGSAEDWGWPGQKTLLHLLKVQIEEAVRTIKILIFAINYEINGAMLPSSDGRTECYTIEGSCIKWRWFDMFNLTIGKYIEVWNALIVKLTFAASVLVAEISDFFSYDVALAKPRMYTGTGPLS